MSGVASVVNQLARFPRPRRQPTPDFKCIEAIALIKQAEPKRKIVVFERFDPDVLTYFDVIAQHRRRRRIVDGILKLRATHA